MDKIDEAEVVIDYTNHRGERASRRIRPLQNGFFYGKTEWHPKRQWLLDAFDCEKNDTRTFAVVQIHSWRSPDAKQTMDEMVVTQLKRSMERNARMANRVAKLHRLLSGMIGESPIAASEIETALNRLINGNRAIEAILKDEEPTWPAALTR
jgi:predicted DNA-binding transcriptional regulator YafY